MKEMKLLLAKLILFILLLLYYGLLYGLIAFIFVNFLVIKAIEITFNAEFMQGQDSVFFAEYESSPNLIIGALEFEKMSFEDFKNTFKEKALRKFNKMNQSVELILSHYFWINRPIEKSLDNVERLSKFSFGPTEGELSLNSKQIQGFIEKEFSIPLDIKNRLWKIFYLEDFNEEKSMFIIKYHHSLGDGESLLNLLFSLGNNGILKIKYNENKKMNKNLVEYNFLQKLLIILISPFAFFLININNSKEKYEYPLIRKTEGKKLGLNCIAKSKEVNLDILKAKIKNYLNICQFTINDFLVYIINLSIKNYIDNHEKTDNINCGSNKKKEKSDTIIAMLGMSMRTQLENNKLENLSAAKILEYNFRYNKENINDLNDSEEIRKINKINDSLRNRFFMASACFCWNFVMSYFMNRNVILKLSESKFKNISYLLTNVRGIDTTTDINGKQILNFLGYVPHANLPLSFLAYTYNNNLTLTVNSSRSYEIDVEFLMNIIDNNIKNFINY